MDRPNEGIAEAGENEAPLLMTCSGGTSVIKDLHTIDLARCVVDVSRVQLLEGPRAVALSGPASHGLPNNVKVYSPVYLGWSDGFTLLGVIAIL